MQMTIREVISGRDKKAWHKFQRDLYRNEPNFSAPIEKLIEKIFTPGKNEFFENGAATRFLLYDEEERVVGRVAAFINGKKAYTYQQPTGGMGFFECIDNQQAADMLFDACKQWLAERGMQAMDGPINFGENDNYWGLLVEGFEPSAWGMNYNFPYYKKLFENYGFKLYFEQVSNLLDFGDKGLPERVYRIADYVAEKGGFFCRSVDMKHIDRYMHDMKEVYDDAWRFHENFVPLQTATMQKELDEGKGLIDPDMLLFAYHKGEDGREEPVAFLIMIPDAAPIFKRFNGKLNLINKIRFLLMKRKHYLHRARITIMGVKVKYQRSGIESFLIAEGARKTRKKPWYTHIELSWVGDFNPKMRALHESVGARFHQRHYTYRVLFDKDKAFERSEIIARDTKNKNLKI